MMWIRLGRDPVKQYLLELKCAHLPKPWRLQQEAQGKPCAARESFPGTGRPSGRGEVEAHAVGALRAVRQGRSSNPERAMNYLKRARQGPTAFRAV